MLRTYQEKHTENKERYPKRKMKTERERERKRKNEKEPPTGFTQVKLRR